MIATAQHQLSVGSLRFLAPEVCVSGHRRRLPSLGDLMDFGDSIG